MKASVYIESSVISYCVARTSQNLIVAARQAITQEWWNSGIKRYTCYISAVVEREISAGDPEAAKQRRKLIAEIPSLQVNEDAQDLTQGLLSAQLLPIGSVDDALHIAIASVHGMAYLLTWNFKHINNAETKGRIMTFVEKSGYRCPVLCSPEELGGSFDD